MTEASQASGSGPGQRQVEMGVAVATLIFGIIVIIGSLSAGITWASDGPRAGFFPFYLGLFIVISSVINFARVRLEVPGGKIFATWSELGSVTKVVIPIIVYVGLVPPLGIYAASGLLIGVFMKWLGKFGWMITLIIAITIPVATFVIFERWFLIPLPKGPLEDFLNL